MNRQLCALASVIEARAPIARKRTKLPISSGSLVWGNTSLISMVANGSFE